MCIRPIGRPLAGTPPSWNNRRLEKTKRRGFFRTKYGISNNGKARRPNRAVGLRNSIGLLEKADLRQRREDKVAQIAISDIERVMNIALVAETADFQIVMRQFRLIVAPRVAAPLIAELSLGFAVDQG